MEWSWGTNAFPGEVGFLIGLQLKQLGLLWPEACPHPSMKEVEPEVGPENEANHALFEVAPKG